MPKKFVYVFSCLWMFILVSPNVYVLSLGWWLHVRALVCGSSHACLCDDVFFQA